MTREMPRNFEAEQGLRPVAGIEGGVEVHGARDGEQCLAPLLRSVHRRRQFRIPAFAERHVQDHDAVAGLVLLDQKCAGAGATVRGRGAYGSKPVDCSTA